MRRAIHNQQGLFGVKANLTLSGLISTSVWLEVKRPQRCISCSNSNSCVQLQRRSTICGFLKWMQDKSRRCSSRLQTSPLQIMSRPPSCRMISYLIINVEPFWMMVHLLCLQSHSWHEAKRLVGKEKHGGSWREKQEVDVILTTSKLDMEAFVCTTKPHQSLNWNLTKKHDSDFSEKRFLPIPKKRSSVKWNERVRTSQTKAFWVVQLSSPDH